VSAAHLLYIPAVFLIGLVCGYMFGQRTLIADLERRNAKRKL
jgi:hypothetical protein